MTGSAASKKQPIFEQLSLANIFVSIGGMIPPTPDAQRRWAAT
jgi:hypothetical protein